MNAGTSLRRRLLLVIALLGGGTVLLIAVYRYLVSPELVVTAPVGSTVAIRMLPGTSVAQHTTSSPATVYHVGAGTYVLRIETTDAKQLFYGTANYFQHKIYRLAAAKEPRSSAVGNRVAYNALRDTSGAIIYLDT